MKTRAKLEINWKEASSLNGGEERKEETRGWLLDWERKESQKKERVEAGAKLLN